MKDIYNDVSNMDKLLILAAKEDMLNQIIVWLRVKGLWEECEEDLTIKLSDFTDAKENH